MKSSSCELCGSHELRIDYYTRTVRAVRFPIDVTEALKNAPWHPLLHPASAITRKAFYNCGTLSEERIFGNDTKFLLNSFFILKSIKKIDEFLYIRKIHPNSLTTPPDTMLGSPITRNLLHTWDYDFEQIKRGILQLDDSSLKFEGTRLIFNIYKLSKFTSPRAFAAYKTEEVLLWHLRKGCQCWQPLHYHSNNISY